MKLHLLSGVSLMALTALIVPSVNAASRYSVGEVVNVWQNVQGKILEVTDDDVYQIELSANPDNKPTGELQIAGTYILSSDVGEGYHYTFVVKQLAPGAFKDCGITSVRLGFTFMDLPESAFSGCTKLEKVTYRTPGLITRIGDNAFNFCRSLKEIDLSAVDYVGTYALSQTALEHVEMPEVENIGNGAFQGCKNLSNIIVGDKLKTIGDNAFGNCKALLYITLPDGLSTIGERAFSACESLNSFVIPRTVYAVGESAFSDCRLEYAYILSDYARNFAITSNLLTNESLKEVYAVESIIPDLNKILAGGGAGDSLKELRIQPMEDILRVAGVSDTQFALIPQQSGISDLTVYNEAGTKKLTDIEGTYTTDDDFILLSYHLHEINALTYVQNVSKAMSSTTEINTDGGYQVNGRSIIIGAEGRVYDINGRQMADTSNLAPGIYVVKTCTATSRVLIP